MEILLAVMWAAELSLCNCFAIHTRKSKIYVLKGVSIMFPFAGNLYGNSLFSQGNEEETLNILRKIYKINNPKSEADYNVTKVVEDLEFIDNDSREITNVSKNPFVMLWKQTCLLFSSKNVKKTVLICLMQASCDRNHVRNKFIFTSHSFSADCSVRAMDFICSFLKSSIKSRSIQINFPLDGRRFVKCF